MILSLKLVLIKLLDENMNQSSSKINPDNSEDDNTESDRLSPPAKRRCQTSNSKLCLPDQSSCVLIDLTPDEFEENKQGCKSCGKQETLLKTFNCPSLHYFCLNCIFNWTQNMFK
jgi:arginyl-tRNA--protein-N-Asp/Glu arginylyltransferase